MLYLILALIIINSSDGVFYQTYDIFEHGYASYYEGEIIEIDKKNNSCKFYNHKGEVFLNLTINKVDDRLSLTDFKITIERYDENQIQVFLGEDNDMPAIYRRHQKLSGAEIEILEKKHQDKFFEVAGHFFARTTEDGNFEPIHLVEENYFEAGQQEVEKYYFDNRP